MSINSNDMHTGYPGFISDFDPITQTGTVRLAIESAYIGMEPGYKLVPKSVISSVPVQFPQGGGWALTFPVPDGTPCYIHFAQRGIDHWLFEGKDAAGMLGGKPAPQFGQKFAIENAVAVVGINPIPNAIQGFSVDGMTLRNADASQSVALKGDGSIALSAGDTTIVIQNGGEILITSTSSAKISASEIELKGNTKVVGNLRVEGDMDVTGTANGISIENHQHPYYWTDGSGEDNTGAPV